MALDWVHEYVHQGGGSFPERVVTKMAPLSAAEAQAALAAGAATS